MNNNLDATMLIVDDNEISRDVLKTLFENKYILFEAESGEEAFAVAKACQGSIDIMILDLVMTGMSGFDFLELRRNEECLKEIPVIIITGSDEIEDQIKAFELGANDFIMKPYAPEVVMSRVGNIMMAHKRMLSIELEAEKLKIKSELDQMTGILNKMTTEATVNKILETNNDVLNAMLVVDIDNFKVVNDVMGHLMGDHVIKIIADLLSTHFRKSDIVGRIGGDEFAVLMTNLSSMDAARTKVDELIQLMKYKPNLTIPEKVSLSIGIADNSQALTTYSELFKKADCALRRAKADGKGCYREYGIEPVQVVEDYKLKLLLISHNRDVCAAINALSSSEIKIVEVMTFDELDNIDSEEGKNFIAIFVDSSDMKDEIPKYWSNLCKYSWMDFSKVIAICEEGFMQQYAAALGAGVGDIITSPVDRATLKRRTARLVNADGKLLII